MSKVKLKWSEMNVKQRVFHVLDWFFRIFWIGLVFAFILYICVSAWNRSNTSENSIFTSNSSTLVASAERSWAKPTYSPMWMDSVDHGNVWDNYDGQTTYVSYAQFYVPIDLNFDDDFTIDWTEFYFDFMAGGHDCDYLVFAYQNGYLYLGAHFVECHSRSCTNDLDEICIYNNDYFNSGSMCYQDVGGVAYLTFVDVIMPSALYYFFDSYCCDTDYMSALDTSYSSGSSSGYSNGYSSGYSSGYLSGYSNGYSNGSADLSDEIDSAYNSGYEDGTADGIPLGYDTGYDDGYSDGTEYGKEVGDTIGYERGYQAGFADSDAGGFSWLISSVQQFLNFNFFGDFGVGTLLYVGLGGTLVCMFLKMFT
jgi:hypothetical protein